MDYIKYEDGYYVNKKLGDPIIESSFLVKVVEEKGKWHEVRERDIITFSRYIDGYALTGVLGFMKKYKVKSRKFKGLE